MTNHFRRKFRLPLLIILILSFCTACSQSGSSSAGHDLESRLGASASANKRIMTYSANLSLQVSSLKEVDEKVKQIVTAEEGFLAQSSSGEKYYSASIRVPAERLNQTINKLSELGEVSSKSVNAQDVTNTYVDLEAKIKNLTALRDRYRLVLEKAKDMKDILAVEQELNRVQGEIEQLETQLRGVKEHVRYSNLEFLAKETTILGPLGYLVHGATWVVSKLFVIR